MKTQKTTKSKKKTKVVGIIVDIVLALAIIFAIFVTYSAYSANQKGQVPSLFGLHMSTVLSDSMKPTFEKGDMVFTVDVDDVNTLEVGDVISFWTVIEGERAINTHRIVKIDNSGTSLKFITQGDNNTTEDSAEVSEKELIGVYKGHIDNLGTVFDFMQSSTGFLIVIVVPVGLFFIWQLVQFFIALFAYQGEKQKRAFAAANGIVIKDDDEEEEKPAEPVKEEKAEEPEKPAEGEEKKG